jgi:monoamine oxidase
MIHQRADVWRDRLSSGTESFDQKVSRALLEATGKPADEKDLVLAQRFRERYKQELSGMDDAEAERQTLSAYLRSLFGSNAFLYVD